MAELTAAERTATLADEYDLYLEAAVAVQRAIIAAEAAARDAALEDAERVCRERFDFLMGFGNPDYARNAREAQELAESIAALAQRGGRAVDR